MTLGANGDVYGVCLGDELTDPCWSALSRPVPTYHDAVAITAHARSRRRLGPIELPRNVLGTDEIREIGTRLSDCVWVRSLVPILARVTAARGRVRLVELEAGARPPSQVLEERRHGVKSLMERASPRSTSQDDDPLRESAAASSDVGGRKFPATRISEHAQFLSRRGLRPPVSVFHSLPLPGPVSDISYPEALSQVLECNFRSRSCALPSVLVQGTSQGPTGPLGRCRVCQRAITNGATPGNPGNSFPVAARRPLHLGPRALAVDLLHALPGPAISSSPAVLTKKKYSTRLHTLHAGLWPFLVNQHVSRNGPRCGLSSHPPGSSVPGTSMSTAGPDD